MPRVPRMASFIGADYRLCSLAMNGLVSDIRKDLPQALQLLEQMVMMESPSFDKPLVDAFAQFVADRFSELGGQADVVPADRFGDQVIVRFGSADTQPILLLGHTDTVFSTGEIQKRPFQSDGDRATGPGVFDMKGGILLMWMAIRSLLRREEGLQSNVTVLLTSDEEVGSNA